MSEGIVSTRKFIFAAASMLVAILLLASASSHARAASQPFQIAFDKSDIQLGTIGQLPLSDLGTGASIKGTINNGVVTIPKGGFTFPKLGITDPVSVSGEMSLEGPATGTFDATTGQLELDAQAGIYATLDVKGLVALLQASGVDINSLLGGSGSVGGFSVGTIIGLVPTLTCGFAPMDIHFSTEGSSLAEGKRFDNGSIDGSGAITAEWTQLGPFAGKTKILGFLDACTTIKGLLPGLLGGLAGSAGLPIDIGSLNLGSLLNNLDAVNLGPSGITLTKTSDTSIPIPIPDPDPAALKLNVSPKTSTVKRGKKINYRVKIANTGEEAATGVKLCVKLPPKALSGKPCMTVGSVSASASKTRNMKVKVKSSAAKKSYQVRFLAKAESVRATNSSVSIRAR